MSKKLVFLRSGADFWEAKVSQNDDFFDRSKIEFCIVKTMVLCTLALPKVIKNEMKKVCFLLKKMMVKKSLKSRLPEAIPILDYHITSPEGPWEEQGL